MMGSPPGLGLLRSHPDAVGRLVLDVTGHILEVGRMDVISERLAGGHLIICGSSGSGSGSGSGDNGGGYGASLGGTLCTTSKTLVGRVQLTSHESKTTQKAQTT